jgi:hypothetical protein
MPIGEGHEVTLATGMDGLSHTALGHMILGGGPWYQHTCSCGFDWGKHYTDSEPGPLPHCPNVRITQDECALIHGHCFESTGLIHATNPPQYPEVCKHCGKRRVGVPREPMTYYDPDESRVRVGR